MGGDGNTPPDFSQRNFEDVNTWLQFRFRNSEILLPLGEYWLQLRLPYSKGMFFFFGI